MLKNLLLILLCIAVMGGGLFLARRMKEPQQNVDEVYPQITAIDGIAAGKCGDIMRNVFFDFTVNSTETAFSYKDLKPSSGMKFIIVSLTLYNPCSSPLPMFDTDFQLYYGSEEEEWEVPLTYYDLTSYREGMLESEYTLNSKETIRGDLVFSVPAETDEYEFVYEEYFESGETGDRYIIEFSG